MREFISIPWVNLIWPALAGFALVLVTVPRLVSWAKSRQLFGPIGGRHLHTQPMVRLGGLSIAAAILLSALVSLGVTPALIGFYLGLVLVLIVGLLDDLYGLPASLKLMVQVLAAAVLIFFGSSVGSLTNPLGGVLLLHPLLDIIITIFWIVLVINSINFLDGMDGLASGISAIAAVTISAVSLLAIVNQPSTAQLASIVFGASAGFLIYNWHPAKLFMGDSGSHVLGFSLAAIAVISGSKLATAALVLGLPIIDLIWSAIRRIRSGRTPWSPDKEHLHHLLMSRGHSQPQVVVGLYLVACSLGGTALIATTWGKIGAFVCAVLLVILLLRAPRQV